MLLVISGIFSILNFLYTSFFFARLLWFSSFFCNLFTLTDERGKRHFALIVWKMKKERKKLLLVLMLNILFYDTSRQLYWQCENFNQQSEWKLQ